MRGHEALVAMRMRGHVPASVTIDADGVLPRWATAGWMLPTYPGAPLHAEVVIDPVDTLDRLDLRCFVGLTVQVHGAVAERVQAIAMACSEAGAKRVVSSVAVPDGNPDDIVINDTEGLLTWPR